MVEKLVRARHLRQYIRSEGKNRESSQNSVTTTPVTSVPLRVVINCIHGGPLDEEYNSKRKRQRLLRAAFMWEWVSSIPLGLTNRSIRLINGTITFLLVDSHRIVQPHKDALILTLGVSDFDVRRILVDLRSLANLLQAFVIKKKRFSPSNLENPGRILSGFNGASTTS